MIAETGQFDFLTKPIVQAWLGMLKRSAESKREFNELARQVNSLYSKPSSYMWKPEYVNAYMGKDITPPKFQMTVNKPFEYVSIFLPLLWWDYPNRKVARHKRLQFDAEILSGGDPNRQQVLEQLLARDAFGDVNNDARCQLFDKYLNYSQLVQPGEGLSHHIEMALVDALVKGRGVLAIEPYRVPGSQTTLTGAFYRSVDDLFIDPDCVDPTLTTADWVAIRHLEHFSKVEERFGLPKNELRGKGTLETSNGQWDSGTGMASDRGAGQERKNLIEWYEIWSRCGIGAKLSGIDKPIYSGFDEVAGDFVYLCISPSMPKCPLNLTTRDMVDENYGGEGIPFTDDDLVEKLQWPTPTWMANRFPVALLDFTLKSNSAWPIPPMAPAIGYMSCLNILVSCLAQQGYDSRTLAIAYMEGAIPDLKKKIESNETPLLIGIDADLAAKQITEIIQYLKRPEMNNDLPKTIEFISQKIAESTGLLPLLYASNEGGVDRSAEASKNRNSKATLRPEHMGQKVSKWQTVVAELEKICAYYHVKSDDVAPLMGETGAMLWGELVENADPQAVLHGMYCTVEASDMQKPDRDKQVGDLSKLMQWLLPILGTEAAATGNYSAVNGFIESFGDGMEQDVSRILVPPREQQQPDPMMQAQTEAELDLTAAKAEKLRADAAASGATAGVAQQAAEAKAMSDQAKMEMDRQKLEHSLGIAQSQAELSRQKAEHTMSLAEQKAELQRQAAEQSAIIKGAQAEHGIGIKHDAAALALEAKRRQMQLAAEQAIIKANTDRMLGQQKLQHQAVSGMQDLMQSDQQHKQSINQAAIDMWSRIQERRAATLFSPKEGR